MRNKNADNTSVLFLSTVSPTVMERLIFMSSLFDYKYARKAYVGFIEGLGTSRPHLWSVPISKFEDEVKKLKGKRDVYYSLNPLNYDKTMHMARQTKDNVAGLGSLWVDLDFYDIKGLDQKKVLKAIGKLAKSGIIPYPDVIKDSGRGLMLQWLFKENENVKAVSRWKRAQRYLFDVFKKYGADPSVVEDESRVTRVPGTINSKSGNKVKFLYLNDRPTLTLYSFISDYVPVDYKTSKFVNNITIFTTDQMKRVNLSRVRDLENILLNSRDYEYRRELNSFYIVNLLIQAGFSREEAYNRICSVHRQMVNPLSDKELMGICNGLRIGTYKFTNEYIIEKLGLTDEELKENKTIVSKKISADRKCVYNRKRYYEKLKENGKETKHDRVSKALDIMQDMINDGSSVAAICEALCISRRTYYNYIGILKNRETYDEKHEEKLNSEPTRQENPRMGKIVPFEAKRPSEAKKEPITDDKIVVVGAFEDCAKNFVTISKNEVPIEEGSPEAKIVDELTKSMCEGFEAVTWMDKCPFGIPNVVRVGSWIREKGNDNRYHWTQDIPDLSGIPDLDEWGDIPEALRL